MSINTIVLIQNKIIYTIYFLLWTASSNLRLCKAHQLFMYNMYVEKYAYLDDWPAFLSKLLTCSLTAELNESSPPHRCIFIVDIQCERLNAAGQ